MYPSLISPFFVRPPVVNIPESGLEGDSSRAGQWLRDLATSNDLRFVDPMKVLCPAATCKRKGNIGWFYVDDHHLSKQGANLMKQEFLEALK
jgi:hypothetical protein